MKYENELTKHDFIQAIKQVDWMEVYKRYNNPFHRQGWILIYKNGLTETNRPSIIFCPDYLGAIPYGAFGTAVEFKEFKKLCLNALIQQYMEEGEEC